MILPLLKKISLSKNDRHIKKFYSILQEIKNHESALSSKGVTIESLREKTSFWRGELKKTPENLKEKVLEGVLAEAYAVVRTAASLLRGKKYLVCGEEVIWDMVHFDVQMLGGIALHNKSIAEMATGEGKTLVSTLPIFLNALTGDGVHVVTANEYLAERDKETMGFLFNALGLSVGVLKSDQDTEEKKRQYGCDITYGTQSEFGFDYLRDQGLSYDSEDIVQRGHPFVLIDEADSILIDEAKTPMVISGEVDTPPFDYNSIKDIVAHLVRVQNELCNNLLLDAVNLLERAENEKAAFILLKVKYGMPKHPLLLELIEDAQIRKLLEKIETSLYKKNRKDLFEIRKDLYFSVINSENESELTDKGRDEVEKITGKVEFLLPDIINQLMDIEAENLGSENLGAEEIEKKKSLAHDEYSESCKKIHALQQLLRAYCLYQKDKDYIIEDNKVIIIDPFTGRKMSDRRWSDGLHQAVEVKEGVPIAKETQTFATITTQNYFLLYKKICGMTGTAATEKEELHNIYGLEVVTLPTNKPIQRIDENDRVFATKKAKLSAVADEVKRVHSTGQPILIGTTSVEQSETMSKILTSIGLKHEVLNAKQHYREANIIRNAGQLGSITIATNMAGRGTDIKLGEGVKALGGLFVLGTERHESRRIDNQLRGRCGRQGDPGVSKFYVSFEDDLLSNFGAGDTIAAIMGGLSSRRYPGESGESSRCEELNHPLLNRVIESAQKKVEALNYKARKETLEFDSVIHQQSEIIYAYRHDIITGKGTEVFEDILANKINDAFKNKNDEDALFFVRQLTGVIVPIETIETIETIENREQSVAAIVEKVTKAYQATPSAKNKDLQKSILLYHLDKSWREHLVVMEDLKESIFLKSAQKDPITEYKCNGFKLFQKMMEAATNNIIQSSFISKQDVEA